MSNMFVQNVIYVRMAMKSHITEYMSGFNKYNSINFFMKQQQKHKRLPY